MADDDGKAKLFRHVRLGKTKEVKEALTTDALGVNEQDSKRDTLLHLAARKFLEKSRADSCARGFSGRERKRLFIARSLLN